MPLGCRGRALGTWTSGPRGSRGAAFGRSRAQGRDVLEDVAWGQSGPVALLQPRLAADAAPRLPPQTGRAGSPLSVALARTQLGLVLLLSGPSAAPPPGLSPPPGRTPWPHTPRRTSPPLKAATITHQLCDPKLYSRPSPCLDLSPKARGPTPHRSAPDPPQAFGRREATASTGRPGQSNTGCLPAWTLVSGMSQKPRLLFC